MRTRRTERTRGRRRGTGRRRAGGSGRAGRSGSGGRPAAGFGRRSSAGWPRGDPAGRRPGGGTGPGRAGGYTAPSPVGQTGRAGVRMEKEAHNWCADRMRSACQVGTPDTLVLQIYPQRKKRDSRLALFHVLHHQKSVLIFDLITFLRFTENKRRNIM